MLYINHNLNAVFIHNPKCGGTTISTILMDCYDFEFFNIALIDGNIEREYIINGGSILDLIYNNDKLNNMLGMNKQKWRTYYKFSIVRNPYKRFISAFIFLKNNINKYKLNIIQPDLNIQSIIFYIKNDNYDYDNPDLYDLNEYINIDMNKKISLFSYIHMFLNQSDFLYSENIKIDFIGKLENIHLFFFIIFNKLNLQHTKCIIDYNNKNIYENKWFDIYNEDIFNFVNNNFINDFVKFQYVKYNTFDDFYNKVTTL